jgi:hypothetical protein
MLGASSLAGVSLAEKKPPVNVTANVAAGGMPQTG